MSKKKLNKLIDKELKSKKIKFFARDYIQISEKLDKYQYKLLDGVYEVTIKKIKL